MKVFKKISIITLCSFLIFTAMLVLTEKVSLKELQATSVSEKHIQKKGDVNGDGYVTIEDLTALKPLICQHQFKGEDIIIRADVNQDGEYDMRDIINLKKILGIIPASAIPPKDWTDPEITPPTPED